jgi:DNA-binding CsgD family transcriptional regulator
MRSVLCPGLVGRAAELGVLRDALAGAAAGGGAVVFLLGEAGIGKSRLTREAADVAAGRGFSVSAGRSVDSPTPVAFRALAEALCACVREVGEAALAEVEPFRPVLGRLVPQWGEGGSRPDASVVGLAEAVLRFLRAAALGRGALLVLEDLHWADPDTLAVVEYLADNLAREPVLLLATLRDEEPSAGLELARTLHSRRAAELVTLDRLRGPDLAEMVEQCLGAAPGPDLLALAARAEGVPFLVEELFAGAVSAGALVAEAGGWRLLPSSGPVVPATFADTVLRRLSALGEEPRLVVRAAAVLGRRFPPDLLPATARLEPGNLAAALRPAVQAQLVEVDGLGPDLRFRHALTREAVLADLLPPERAELSRRALDALDARVPAAGGPPPEEDVALAAALAEAAGDGGRAARLLLVLARHALTRGALATAEGTLRRAAVLAPDADAVGTDVAESLVEVLSLAGRPGPAAEAGAAVLRRLEKDPGAARRRAEVHVRLARAAVVATDWEAARGHVDRARAEAGADPDSELTARANSIEALAALGADRPERAGTLARAALSVAERIGLPEVACEALEVLGRMDRWRDLAGAEAAFRRGLAIAERHDLGVWRLRALHELGTIDMLESGDTARLEEAHRLALRFGALATAADLGLQIGAGRLSDDDPEPAAVICRAAADLAGRLGLRQTLGVALAFEATAHARAGRAADMERCLAAARLELDAGGDLEVLDVGARVYLAYVRDDAAAALRLLGASAEARYSAPFAGAWALLRAVRDRSPDAVAEIHGRGEPVEFSGRAYLRYAEAVVAGRAGRLEEADAALAAGDALLAPYGWFRHYGHRLVAEAAIVDGWGDPVTLLHEAQDYFSAAGNRPVASTCRSLLRRAGAPVRRRGPGSADVPESLRALGVTAREADVLSLVAAGLTNREIAERLFLSPRTVETHVERLLAKTGSPNRRELSRFARLGRLGP